MTTWCRGESAPPGASASVTEKLRSLCAVRSRTTSPCPAAGRAPERVSPASTLQLHSAAARDRLACSLCSAACPGQTRAARVLCTPGCPAGPCNAHLQAVLPRAAVATIIHGVLMRSALTSVAIGLCGDTCHMRWRASGRARRRCGGCSGTQQGVQWSRHACSDSRRAPSPSALRAGLGPAPGSAGRAQQGAVDSRAPPPASMRSSHQTTSACAVPAAVTATCTLAGDGIATLVVLPHALVAAICMRAGMQPSQRCPTQAERPPRAQRMCRARPPGGASRPAERAGCWPAASSPAPVHPGRRPQGVAATVPHMWLEGALHAGRHKEGQGRVPAGRPSAPRRAGPQSQSRRAAPAATTAAARAGPAAAQAARGWAARRKAGPGGTREGQLERQSPAGQAPGHARRPGRARRPAGPAARDSCSRLGGRTGCHTQHGLNGSVCLTMLMLIGVTCRRVAARQHNRHLLRRLSLGHSAARQGRRNSACGCQVMHSPAASTGRAASSCPGAAHGRTCSHGRRSERTQQRHSHSLSTSCA